MTRPDRGWRFPDWENSHIGREHWDFGSAYQGLIGSDAPTGPISIAMACLIRYLSLKRVVEIGVWKGSTSVLFVEAVRCTGGSYVGVDIDIRAARERIEREGLSDYATFLKGESSSVEYNGEWINFLMIDGDHSYDGARIDWIRWEKWVAPGGWIWFDNYSRSEGLFDFVNELKEENDQSTRPYRMECISSQKNYGFALFHKVAQ